MIQLRPLAPWIALVVLAPTAVFAAVPRPGEIAAASRWTAERFDGKGQPAQLPPISFFYNRQPSSTLLPHWRVQRSTRELDKQRTLHVVTYADPTTGLEIGCYATEYHDFPAVEWVVSLRDSGRAPTPVLDQIQPLDLAMALPANNDVLLHRSRGDVESAHSFEPIDEPLTPGADRKIAPVGGRSSDGEMPYFNLDWKSGGMVVAIGWSGEWEAHFRRSQAGTVQVQAGMQLTHLSLLPGETIRTPAILALLWDGSDSTRGYNLFRSLMLAHYCPRKNGNLVLPPISGTTNSVDPGGNYEQPHLRAMAPLAERGIEVFWSDMDPQQWYPGEFPNGTGTWEPDRVKYPHGLKPIGDAAHRAGLGYLLWFEPERAAPSSRIAKERPGWVMKASGEPFYLLRLQDPVIRKSLTDYIDVQIRDAQLDWIRWDYNIHPLGFWRHEDPPDRQGITEIRYIEGLYAMWDDLRQRHPGLQIDNCASGGRRLDFEALRRSLPLWISDFFGQPNADAEQAVIAGLSHWAPLHGATIFGLEGTATTYEFRSTLNAGGILVSDTILSAGSAEPMRRSVSLIKEMRPYFLGDFFELLPNTTDQTAWFACQFHRGDLNQGLVMVFRREKSLADSQAISLRGLDPDRSYEVSWPDTGEKRIMTGQELLSLTVHAVNPATALLIRYRAVKPTSASTR